MADQETLKVEPGKKAVVLFNIHDTGHLNPMLYIAKLFVTYRSDIQVLFFAPEQVREKVVNTGAQFCEYGPNWDLFEESAKATKEKFGLTPSFIQQRAMPAAVIPAAVQVVPKLLEKLEPIKDQISFMMHDGAVVWGYVLAKMMNIQSVCIMTALPMKQGKSDIKRKFAKLRSNIKGAKFITEVFGVPYDQQNAYSNFTEKNIITVSRGWAQPSDEDYPRSMYKFWGPALFQDSKLQLDAEDATLARVLEEKKKGKKIIYLCLGTIVTRMNNFYVDVLQHIYKESKDAFQKEENTFVVISAGSKAKIDPAPHHTLNGMPLPENFLAVNFLPQKLILDHSDCFISHCGMNSVNEALSKKVPIVGIPFFGDQPENAKRVQKLSIGKYIDMKLVQAENKKKMLDVASSENWLVQSIGLRIKNFTDKFLGWKEPAAFDENAFTSDMIHDAVMDILTDESYERRMLEIDLKPDVGPSDKEKLDDLVHWACEAPKTS